MAKKVQYKFALQSKLPHEAEWTTHSRHFTHKAAEGQLKWAKRQTSAWFGLGDGERTMHPLSAFEWRVQDLQSDVV